MGLRWELYIHISAYLFMHVRLTLKTAPPPPGVLTMSAQGASFSRLAEKQETVRHLNRDSLVFLTEQNDTGV